MTACSHCALTPLVDHAETEHPTLCCDCFDLSLGMPVDAVNAGRAVQGRPAVAPWPVEPPRPGLDCLTTMLVITDRITNGGLGKADEDRDVLEHMMTCPRCRHLVAGLLGEPR